MSKELEHKEQCAVIRWCDYNLGKYPELALLYATPNGGQRHIAVAAKLKREGVLAGVLDLFLAVARKDFHGLYIEMKIKPNKIKKGSNQEWFMNEVIKQGYKAVVCYSADEAIDVLEDYLT